MNLPPDQGRARGLYDEQLQRLQQEKILIEGGGAGAAAGPVLFRTDAVPAPAADAKTGAE